MRCELMIRGEAPATAGDLDCLVTDGADTEAIVNRALLLGAGCSRQIVAEGTLEQVAAEGDWDTSITKVALESCHL